MTGNLQRFGLAELPSQDKAALAWELWEAVVEETQVEPMNDDIEAMLNSRIQYSEQNPGSGIPWEVIEAETEARIRASPARDSA